MSQTKGVLDKVCIALSLACSVHCLILPLLLILLPAVKIWNDSTVFHVLMALLIIPLGSLAFIHGYRHHRQLWVPIIGSVGMIFVLLGLWTHQLESFLHAHAAHEHNPYLENISTLIGSILLTFAHLKNIKYNKQHCHHDYL